MDSRSVHNLGQKHVPDPEEVNLHGDENDGGAAPRADGHEPRADERQSGQNFNLYAQLD